MRLTVGVLAVACALAAPACVKKVGRIVTAIRPVDATTLAVTTCALIWKDNSKLLRDDCQELQVPRSNAPIDADAVRAPRPGEVVVSVLPRDGGGLEVTTCLLGKGGDGTPAFEACELSVVSIEPGAPGAPGEPAAPGGAP